MRLIKDAEGNVARLISINGRIPDGWTLVPDEDISTAELDIARSRQMARIRKRRNDLLRQNDVMWLITSKKGEPTTDIEADAQSLRDLPADAQSDLDQLISQSDIGNYDPFPSMGLTQTYEE